VPFGNLLKKYTKEKKITYKEIANRCNAMGVSITEGHIKEIANGRKRAPTEDKIRAIAKALEVDEKLLVLEGYIDKAPKEIIDFLNNIREIISFFALASMEKEYSRENFEILKSMLHEQSLSVFFSEILDDDNLIYENSKNFTLENDGVSFSLKTDNISFIEITDNSMSPQLEIGDNIILEIADNYVNGEILAVKIKGTNEVIYRNVVFSNGLVNLTAYNKKYSTTTYNRNDIEIIGKVTKVIKNL